MPLGGGLGSRSGSAVRASASTRSATHAHAYGNDTRGGGTPAQTPVPRRARTSAGDTRGSGRYSTYSEGYTAQQDARLEAEAKAAVLEANGWARNAGGALSRSRARSPSPRRTRSPGPGRQRGGGVRSSGVGSSPPRVKGSQTFRTNAGAFRSPPHVVPQPRVYHGGEGGQTVTRATSPFDER